VRPPPPRGGLYLLYTTFHINGAGRTPIHDSSAYPKLTLKKGGMYVRITLRRVRATSGAVEKQQVLHIPSVYLYPSVSSMQCACLILSSVSCPVPQYFQHYLIKGTIFEKKSLNTKCVS
jgi:hypothetical protein